MSFGNVRYCPIIGKKVEIKGEVSPFRKKSLNPVTTKAVCQNESGVCNGNCSACKLM